MYGLGGYNTVFRRKKRSVESEGVEEKEEEGGVGEIGFVIKIVPGVGGTKQISASNTGPYNLSFEGQLNK